MTQDFLNSVRKHVLKPVLIFKSLGLVSAVEDVCPAPLVVTSTTDLLYNSSFWLLLFIVMIISILSPLTCLRKFYGQNLFRLLEKTPDIFISATAITKSSQDKVMSAIITT